MSSTFLVGVIRSQSHHLVKRKQVDALEGKWVPLEELDQPETGTTSPYNPLVAMEAKEQQAEEERRWQRITTHFENDEEVNLILECVIAGVTFKEIQEEWGLSGKRLKAARKRLERTLEKWENEQDE